MPAGDLLPVVRYSSAVVTENSHFFRDLSALANKQDKVAFLIPDSE